MIIFPQDCVLTFCYYPQGDCRTYSYVAALSSDEKVGYEDLMTLAKLIPRICHNVNRYDAGKQTLRKKKKEKRVSMLMQTGLVTILLSTRSML